MTLGAPKAKVSVNLRLETELVKQAHRQSYNLLFGDLLKFILRFLHLYNRPTRKNKQRRILHSFQVLAHIVADNAGKKLIVTCQIYYASLQMNLPH